MVLKKLKRQFTAILPVKNGRRGKCTQCGLCCRLVYKCPFLCYGDDGKAKCRIYPFRFPSCRKYPRCPDEFSTSGSCGFDFN